MKDVNLLNTGTIYYKTVQILAYSDYIDIVARYQRALEEAFLALKIAVLYIDQSETRHMAAEKSWKTKMTPKMSVENHVFERVEEFRHLNVSNVCIV